MGLDLSVVRNLKYICDESDAEGEELDNLYDDKIKLFNNDMLFRQSDGMKSGFYDGEYANEVERVGWSYSGYNNWRKTLAEFSGFKGIDDIAEKYSYIEREETIANVLDEQPDIKREPFIEMCFFSDCEGFIGTKTSLKLYKDFKENESKYESYIDNNNELGDSLKDYYKKSYKRLIEYFRIASEENGAVLFH